MFLRRLQSVLQRAVLAAVVAWPLNPAGAQDYYAPPIPQSGTAFDDYAAVPSGPTWEEFQALARRLEAAEQRLPPVEGQDFSFANQPLLPAENRIHGDGNPHVPSAEQRMAALEKALGHEQGGPHFPSVRLSDFLHLDEGAFSQSASNHANLGDIQDGVGFRRARLQALGKVAEFTNYTIEFDFAIAGRPSFMDLWGEQTNVPLLGNVRIGQFRQPFSLDALTSIRQLDFLERSLPFQALVPFRRVGVMAYDKSESEMWSWGYGLYRTGGFLGAPLGDTRNAADIGDNGSVSATARVTHLLYYDEPAEGRYLLHLGGGYNYSRLNGSGPNANIYESRAIPEFFVGDPAGGGLTAAGTPFILDTGRLRADQFNLFGAEIAGQYGAFHFQGEYMATSVNQIGNPNVFYDGAYLQGGLFLTGENRAYNRMFGAFDQVVPFTDFFSLGRRGGFGGWGAWEVCARWSYLNLNDPNAVAEVVPATIPVSPNPGTVHAATVGLNWVWNPYTNVQFNWIHDAFNSPTFGQSSLNIYAARFQVQF